MLPFDLVMIDLAWPSCSVEILVALRASEWGYFLPRKMCIFPWLTRFWMHIEHLIDHRLASFLMVGGLKLVSWKEDRPL